MTCKMKPEHAAGAAVHARCPVEAVERDGAGFIVRTPQGTLRARNVVLATNGFDERMQYGGQDREFGERLMNMGIKARQVRYRCSCAHLDHGRGYARPESIAKNRSIREFTRSQRITRTDYGIENTAPENAES